MTLPNEMNTREELLLGRDSSSKRTLLNNSSITHLLKSLAGLVECNYKVLSILYRGPTSTIRSPILIRSNLRTQPEISIFQREIELTENGVST